LLCALGHAVVIGIDIDSEKLASLKQGKTNFVEPGLQAIPYSGSAWGNLVLTTDYPRAIPTLRMHLHRRSHANKLWRRCQPDSRQPGLASGPRGFTPARNDRD
jgi:hypothetical protein